MHSQYQLKIWDSQIAQQIWRLDSLLQRKRGRQRGGREKKRGIDKKNRQRQDKRYADKKEIKRWRWTETGKRDRERREGKHEYEGQSPWITNQGRDKVWISGLQLFSINFWWSVLLWIHQTDPSNLLYVFLTLIKIFFHRWKYGKASLKGHAQTSWEVCHC